MAERVRGDRYLVHWRHPDYPAWQVDAERATAGDAIERALQLRVEAPAVEVQVVDDRGGRVWPAPPPAGGR